MLPTPPVGDSKFGVNPLNAKVDPLTANLSLSTPPVMVKVTESPASSVTAKVPTAVCSSATLPNEVDVITGASFTLVTVIVIA